MIKEQTLKYTKWCVHTTEAWSDGPACCHMTILSRWNREESGETLSHHRARTSPSSAFGQAMAPHSSPLAWKIPWMEEPGGLQSMGSLRVRHDWATSLSFFTFMLGEGNGNPLQCSCLENPRDGRAWWAAIYGVTQGQTRLKQLSSSSSSRFT